MPLEESRISHNENEEPQPESYGDIFNDSEQMSDGRLGSGNSRSFENLYDASMSPLTKSFSANVHVSSPNQQRKRGSYQTSHSSENLSSSNQDFSCRPPLVTQLFRKGSTSSNRRGLYPNPRRPERPRTNSLADLRTNYTTNNFNSAPFVENVNQEKNGPRSRSFSISVDSLPANMGLKYRRTSASNLADLCESPSTTPSMTPEPSTTPEPMEHIPMLNCVTSRDGLNRNRISPHQMRDLLSGGWKNLYDQIFIFDCRFQYEYDGGHINGAINITDDQQIEELLFQKLPEAGDKVRRLFIFHCEFSQSRGPRMYDHVRRRDRQENLKRYPHLFFPEMYVLDEGYRGFFNYTQAEKCTAKFCNPPAYCPMDHADFTEECSRDMNNWKRNNKLRRTCSL